MDAVFSSMPWAVVASTLTWTTPIMPYLISKWDLPWQLEAFMGLVVVPSLISVYMTSKPFQEHFIKKWTFIVPIFVGIFSVIMVLSTIFPNLGQTLKEFAKATKGEQQKKSTKLKTGYILAIILCILGPSMIAYNLMDLGSKEIFTVLN